MKTWVFPLLFFFFFNDTATTEIYTLSLHDALPISGGCAHPRPHRRDRAQIVVASVDRKSTRLNSSHGSISYAVFCLKQQKKAKQFTRARTRTAALSLLRRTASI